MSTKIETSPDMSFLTIMANLMSAGIAPDDAQAILWEASTLDETFWDVLPIQPTVLYRVLWHTDGAKHVYQMQVQYEALDETE